MNDIEIDRSAEWIKSLELMRGLYPKWNVTNEQLDVWKQRFGMLNPEWFRESLQVMYSRYNSDTPKPKWVKEAFREVQAGHQGIPLNEQDAMDERRRDELESISRHEALAELDRNKAWSEVSTWSDEERTKWGTLFANKFQMFSGRNDVELFETWSKTFCQFVKVYRSMNTGGENEV